MKKYYVLCPYTTLFRSKAHLRNASSQGRNDAAETSAGSCDSASKYADARSSGTGTLFLARQISTQAGNWKYVKPTRSEEHTSKLQSLEYIVCRILLIKK